MDALISCRALSKAHGTKVLFEQVGISVSERDRLAIIGANGCGKSTLLRILAGHEEPDGGDIARRRGLRMAFVDQSPGFDPKRSVRQIVAAAARSSGQSDEAASVNTDRLLSQLHFGDPTQIAETLSGGWQRRLAIAAAMIQEPEILFLDEPTNHLDIEGIVWLEETLSSAPFAWVLISHDRYLLSSVAKRICEVSPAYQGGTFTTEGSYEQFLERRDEYLAGQAQKAESLSNRVRQETEWLRRGPKARSTKAQARIDNAHRLGDELQSLKRSLAVKTTDIDFQSSGRKTKKLVEIDDVSLTLGTKKIVEGLNFVFAAGTRVGLLGANGAGKSSILKLAAKTLPPSGGQVIHAADLRVVYFQQDRSSLNPDWPLSRVLSDTGDSVIFQGRPIHIASWAKRFLFRTDQLQTPVRNLSGGEQARALVARLMLSEADLLLLDEPTNDLDIPTLEALEDSLLEFAGAIVLVTHDRYLMSRVCNTFLGLDGEGGIKVFASVEQWQKAQRKVDTTKKERDKKPAAAADTVPTAAAPAAGKKRLSYMEQREYDGMEAIILKAENALEAAKTALEDPAIASKAMKLSEASAAYETARQTVETLYARWAELEEKLK